MTAITEPFFSHKHKRLTLIASVANTFAWLTLFFYLLQAVLKVIGFANQTDFFSFEALLKEQPFQFFTFVINDLYIIFEAVAYWLVLRGISLGLNMIVESDLNYRENLSEDRHE